MDETLNTEALKQGEPTPVEPPEQGEPTPKELGPVDVAEGWQVVWPDGGVRVRREADAASEEIKFYPTGAELRGKRSGDWLELVGEPGFMLVHLDGLSLLRLSSEVDSACSWVVVWLEGVKIRRSMDTAAATYGALAARAVVRGLQRGDWLELTDRPGFMLVATQDIELLRPAPVGQWRVLAPSGMNVRSGINAKAEVLRILQCDAVVEGRSLGDWCQLTQEPGFARIGPVAGVALLEQIPSEKSGCAD